MTRTMALLLALLPACGDDGTGTAPAPSEAPLCQPPADLACPEGMRADPQQAGDREGVWCWEGDAKHLLVMRIGGELYIYSPPPFDTVVGCWPPDVAETAYSVAVRQGTPEATGACYDEAGAEQSCEEIAGRHEAAWGL